jgi:integrase
MASFFKPADRKSWQSRFSPNELPNGKRERWTHSGLTRKAAYSVHSKLESLAALKRSGQHPNPELINWMTSLPQKQYDRLVSFGLAAPRIKENQLPTVSELADTFIASRLEVGESTRVTYGHAKRNLIRFFGEDCRIDEITEQGAINFRSWLLTEGNDRDINRKELSEETVRKRCSISKQFFTSAVRSRLISANPFDSVPTSVRGNSDNLHFVTVEDARKVLDACPDAQWRLIFTLCRWGGLRCPSEVLKLRWSDIDWNEKRFTITSPKTKRHVGKGSRVCPLFPEIEQALRNLLEQAEPGTEFCITRYRSTEANLRTQLHKIIRRAGLDPWPRSFQNLRATRATELIDKFPAHVCTAWLGHSDQIARKHYRQVTEEHFTKAITGDTSGDTGGQKRVQNVSASSRKEPQENDVSPCRPKTRDSKSSTDKGLRSSTKWAILGSNQ